MGGAKARRSRRRRWRTVHLAIDAKTLDILAIEVAEIVIGDAAILSALLTRIPPNEQISNVGRDVFTLRRSANAAIATCHADVVIQFDKMGAMDVDGLGTEARNEHRRHQAVLIDREEGELHPSPPHRRVWVSC